MTIAIVFSVIFFGVALNSATEQSPDGPSKERRTVLQARRGQSPQLYFRKMENEEALEWASGYDAEKNEIQLYSGNYKIYPLDKDTAFFFGALETSGVKLRSFLLRSGDGGKTWKDAMEPVHGSEVWDVFFLDGRSGWALTLWSTEGPGDVMLFSSNDGGITWVKVSQVPKRDWTGQPVGMKFADKKNGEIGMLYGNDVAVLKTKDGGRTWAEDHTISFEAYNKQEQETQQSDRNFLQGKDGSQWQMMEKDDRVGVLRRLPGSKTWTKLCAIPMKYRYSNGQISVVQ